MRGCGLFARQYGMGKERGAVAIFTALMLLFVVPAFAALAVDVGRYMFERQQLQNALDAGALAGAQLLPFNGREAAAAARTFARRNDADLEGVNIDVNFGCLVSASSDNPLIAARTQVLALCKQFADADRIDDFSCPGNGRCYLPCTFESPDDTCNAITVQAQISVPLILAPVLQGNTVQELGADLAGHACRGSGGACGPPKDLNLVLFIDWTGSLGADGLDRVREGALSVLGSNFDPDFHKLALGTIPNCLPGEACSTNTANFIRVPLTTEHDRLETAIDNLPAQGGNETNLGSPIQEAIAELRNDDLANPDREDVNKYIILLTDGVPNRPIPDGIPPEPCEHAANQATTAKSDDVRVFTIGYRLELATATCTEAGFEGLTAAELLHSMSTGGENTLPEPDCPEENADADDFYCQISGQELTGVFNQIIIEIFSDLGGSSLVDLSVY